MSATAKLLNLGYGQRADHIAGRAVPASCCFESTPARRFARAERSGSAHLTWAGVGPAPPHFFCFLLFFSGMRAHAARTVPAHRSFRGAPRRRPTGRSRYGAGARFHPLFSSWWIGFHLLFSNCWAGFCQLFSRPSDQAKPCCPARGPSRPFFPDCLSQSPVRRPTSTRANPQIGAMRYSMGQRPCSGVCRLSAVARHGRRRGACSGP